MNIRREYQRLLNKGFGADVGLETDTPEIACNREGYIYRYEIDGIVVCIDESDNSTVLIGPSDSGPMAVKIQRTTNAS